MPLGPSDEEGKYVAADEEKGVNALEWTIGQYSVQTKRFIKKPLETQILKGIGEDLATLVALAPWFT